MSSNVDTEKTSRGILWTGRVLSTLPVLMLILSAIMKFAKPAPFSEGFGKLGFPESLANGLGIVELVCTALYVIPQTSVLGAILLTGYLGGATATHLRVNDPWFGPVLMGVVLWLGLFLRDKRLRALIPFRSRA
ncbi:MULTISPECIES: DoxX family protein [unclassified Schlesneria]|uniref:DoxX family protein n=1 Tax=Schlesneria TaxID=656899 RepID=UPI0035A1194E